MLKKDDNFIIGEGRKNLLELIDLKGSIAKAAEEMDMSYRHAWGIIKKMEEISEEKLVESKRGGHKEKGSTLTPAAKKMISDFEDLKNDHKERVYRNPTPTVDGILVDDRGILLIKRKNSPYKGKYALPGGFVEYGEKLEEAVVREIKEETGFITGVEEMVGVYSDPDRDPRGHMITTVFSLNKIGGKLESGSDADQAKFFGLEDLPELAFDHQLIIKDYLNGHEAQGKD